MTEPTPKEIAKKIVTGRDWDGPGWTEAYLAELRDVERLAADYLRLLEQDERREYAATMSGRTPGSIEQTGSIETVTRRALSWGVEFKVWSRRPAGEWEEGESRESY